MKYFLNGPPTTYTHVHPHNYIHVRYIIIIILLCVDACTQFVIESIYARKYTITHCMHANSQEHKNTCIRSVHIYIYVHLSCNLNLPSSYSIRPVF